MLGTPGTDDLVPGDYEDAPIEQIDKKNEEEGPDIGPLK